MRRFLTRPICTLTVPSTKRLLQPRVRSIFIPLSANTADASHGTECTLYIKGFLAKGEHADHFEDWQRYLSLYHFIKHKTPFPASFSFFQQITSVSVSIHLHIIFRGHKILTDTHKWGSTAHGYFWKSGDLPVCSLPSPLSPLRSSLLVSLSLLVKLFIRIRDHLCRMQLY